MQVVLLERRRRVDTTPLPLEVRGLGKAFRGRPPRRRRQLLRPCGTHRGPPGPQRRRQDHDHPRPARPRRPGRRRRPRLRRAVPATRAPGPAGRRRPRRRRPAPHPDRTPAPRHRRLPRRRDARPDRGRPGRGRDEPRRGPPCRCVLPRHAAADRDRGRAAGRAAPPGPRRALERPRPTDPTGRGSARGRSLPVSSAGHVVACW